MTTLADALSYSALHWSVIPLVRETKKPALKWKVFQRLRPSDEVLHRWFVQSGKDYSLAVVFGQVSGGLGSRDFDEMAAYEQWATDHPDLAGMLPTVATKRGRHVYCRFAPNDIAEFRKRIGKPTGRGAVHCADGEFRIGACYVVIPPSPHPDGDFVYHWLIEPFGRPIPILKVADSGFFSQSPCNRDTECHERGLGEDSLGASKEQTQTPECASQNAVTSGKRRRRNGKWATASIATLATATALPAELAAIEDPIERAILSTVPKERGHRNRLVFALCGALKSIPSLAAASFDELQPIVRRWHNLAKPNIGTLDFESTWADFVHGWPRRRLAKGAEPMSQFVALAIAADPPECVRHYESEPLKQLASLCRELQRASGPEPFYLSARTAGRYFNVNPSTVCRWLTLLRHDHVIDEVKKGDSRTMLATRFRYRGGASANQPAPIASDKPARASIPPTTPNPTVNSSKPALNTTTRTAPKTTAKLPRIFATLDADDLRDDAKVLACFNAATQYKNPVVMNCEANLLKVFGAAERALEHGHNPPALFTDIVKQNAWHLITQAQEDRASQRLRRLRNPEREARREARRRQYDDDDSADEISESRSVGDLVHDMLRSILPTNSNPLDTNHA